MGMKLLENLIRKKSEEEWRKTEGPLVRCLNTFDLTMLGFGCVVGAGLYVVIGQLARNMVGPAIVIAFAVASVAALLAGLCYAEFSSRIPKAGSAYAYTYVALGEIWAFITGWNILLEYFIVAAVLARGCSENIDSLAQGRIYHFFKFYTFQLPVLADFPDLLAVLLVILSTGIVCLGVKQSAVFVTLTSFINMSVVAFIIVAGAYFSVGSKNWSSAEKFLPYGWSGITAAGAGAFFCFIGVEQITTASEEAIDASRAVPRAIIFTLLTSFLAYFAVSTVVTLMVPYYELKEFAPLAEAFNTLGFTTGKYIVITGAVSATISHLISTMFSVPRVIYAMAADGLLFKKFAAIHEERKVPTAAAIASGLFVSSLALFLEIQDLVEMLSIGTLIAYTLLAISVVISRYDPNVSSVKTSADSAGDQSKKLNWWQRIRSKSPQNSGYNNILSEEADTQSMEQKLDPVSEQKELPREEATPSGSFMARIYITCTTASLAGLLAIMSKGWNNLMHGEPWIIISSCLFTAAVLVFMAMLCKQPRNNATFPYMVPCVPFVPVFSIAINLLLIVNLSFWSYIRFAVWLTVGKF